MSKRAVIYTRVSSENQAGEDKVSIEQQTEKCKQLCELQNFEVIEVYQDKEKYTATQAPKKGKLVQPSGTRADRPEFQKMLSLIQTGNIDLIVCFDSSRLGRHLRVLGALADNLDIANLGRNGHGEIQIWEADKNTVLNRLMLSLMITIAQEENETRTRRTRMGRIGTLKQGLWPSKSYRYGYKAIKAERGYRIVKDEQEAEIVEFIFNEAIENSLDKIRVKLIARGYEQRFENITAWSPSIIRSILTTRDYTGHATWNFSNGESYKIEIPQIITPEHFELVQQKLSERKARSKGSIKVPALLHHIAYCGACNAKLSTQTQRTYHYTLKDGTRVIKIHKGLPPHTYACMIGRRYPETKDIHNQIAWNGAPVDEKVWRFLVDELIKKPEVMRRQVELKQENAQQNQDGITSEITRCEQEIKGIEEGRQKLMNQLTRGIISEQDFETVMLQRNKELKYWQDELAQHKLLRDEQRIVNDNLNAVIRFLKAQEAKLADLDRPLKGLPLEEQLRILRERQKIVQVLCDKVYVYADGDLKIEGIIDIPQSHNMDSCTRPRRSG